MNRKNTVKLDSAVRAYVFNFFDGQNNIIEQLSSRFIGPILFAAVYLDDSIEYEIEDTTKITTFDFLFTKGFSLYLIEKNRNASNEEKEIMGIYLFI